MALPEKTPPPAIPVDTRLDSRLVLVIIALTFAGFLAWGLLARLDSGAIAFGELVPDGKVRTIQSLDGGIIRSIRVRDGDQVKAGSELLTLDDAEIRSAVGVADSELTGFKARLTVVKLEIESWSARRGALERIAANVEEENKINRQLYEQKYISRPRLLQLSNQAAQNLAVIRENSAELARARQKATEIESAITTARERKAVAVQKLERTRILAPQDGVVNNLRYATLGGVIPPGGAILDLVPANEKLLVEAKIVPDDIDVVFVGLEVRVKLTAYKARSHITFKGKVVSVSVSTYRDDTTQGRPYYKARIEISPDELESADRTLLSPGMLAQVDIISGPRSALRYLFDPIRDSFSRAFKES